MNVRRVVCLTLAITLGVAVGAAEAVSIRDLVALSQEGVSDQVLIALIETDGSHFTLNAEDVRGLRAQGLSDAVVVAMIRSRLPLSLQPVSQPRDIVVAPSEPEVAPAPAPTPQPPAQIVVQQTVTQVVERSRHDSRPTYVPVYVPVAVPQHARPEKEEKKAEPVYWGNGGKLRPDSWIKK